ncbi:MAG: bifunctional diaminohydroxyphosphoribosylaminopyrimidine deaminase/5-amino-6-(5-phosphoribosylamino)uracil reductase RibD [Clostridiales bacterium]|nr:bifunctional diaminohydroxyphosphoribosylaminopyrimidine deaminase/5-amino-6-(5-phosphoribosylamino)uracil reductase RibD [Clostridiales bacterium]
MQDEQYMRRAIELAKRGSGHVNPNPMVGAVIVRDGEILGEGWHEQYGQLHAERNAIAHAKAAGYDLAGSTIYVTLEPCCHYGKTPPCTEAIIEEGIQRVVVGSVEPTPLVSGKGLALLRDLVIEVVRHFLKKECDAINGVFFHYIKTGLPYVTMKYAMTMDGKIACHTGDSKWVTGEEARAHVQKLRNHYKGIMAGIGTVLADDPMLNCRLEGGRDPIRIICDDHLRIPLDAKLVRTAGQQPLIVACLPEADEHKAKQLIEQNVTVLRIPREGAASGDHGQKTFAGDQGYGMTNVNDYVSRETLDLSLLMEELGRRKIDGILLEGGGTLNESALRAGIVSKVYCYIAPKIFGGAGAKTPVEGCGVGLAKDGWMFAMTGMQRIESDLLLEYDRKA